VALFAVGEMVGLGGWPGLAARAALIAIAAVLFLRLGLIEPGEIRSLAAQLRARSIADPAELTDDERGAAS
jgi:hypothetical protein